ncbi:MAG: MarR family transcriptional regulator, partial [Erysipelotrichales bacterium]
LLMDQINRFIRLNRPKPKDTKLRPSEMMVLMVLCHRHLSGQGSVVPSELSKELSLSRPALTPILNELEAKGLIRREFDVKDRRRTKIVIQEAKIHEIKAGFGNYTERFQLLMDAFTPEELISFYKLLTKANFILNEYNKENSDEKSI